MQHAGCGSPQLSLAVTYTFTTTKVIPVLLGRYTASGFGPVGVAGTVALRSTLDGGGSLATRTAYQSNLGAAAVGTDVVMLNVQPGTHEFKMYCSASAATFTISESLLTLTEP